MRRGARTPEELETLFEDAFVTRDRAAITRLFEEGAVLVADEEAEEARGGAEIAQFATAMWNRDLTYLADPNRILQARDTALVVAQSGINVVRRTDGTWRYAISLLKIDHSTERKGT
jgi:ketosteroid isomerase-like protein